MSYPLALPPRSGEVLCWRAADYEALLAASRQSPRRRMIQPVHRGDRAPVQRLLNAMQPGTYVRPHRHPVRGACEAVVLLQGKILVLIYGEQGEILQRELLQQVGELIDIEPGVWHSMVCLAPDSLITEFKKGPYDRATDKEFAPWAPHESDSEAVHRYLATFQEE